MTAYVPPTTTNAKVGNSIHVDVVEWDALRGLRDSWRALAAGAMEPNIFYDPGFAIPSADALGLARRLRALVIRREGAAPPIGLFPFIEKRRWGLPLNVGEALVHPYAMSSAPLVDPASAGEVIGAFLDWLEFSPKAPAAWLFRFLPENGALHEELAVQITGADIPYRRFFAHERAVLDTRGLDTDYLREALSHKSRKEYARLRRRLSGHGVVTVTRAVKPADVATAIAEFLVLEASGWKGRGGTAAANSKPIADMFGHIGAGLSAGGQIRVDALRIDGKPISMAVSCGRGDRWWLWKIAYDEDFSRFSPGVLLVLYVTEMALEAEAGEQYDSCALPGHPMIERIWRQRRPYADVLLVPARHAWLPQTARQLENVRRMAEQGAREARRLASEMRLRLDRAAGDG